MMMEVHGAFVQRWLTFKRKKEKKSIYFSLCTFAQKRLKTEKIRKNFKYKEPHNGCYGNYSSVVTLLIMSFHQKRKSRGFLSFFFIRCITETEGGMMLAVLLLFVTPTPAFHC